jgi:hypothetical protein
LPDDYDISAVLQAFTNSGYRVTGGIGGIALLEDDSGAPPLVLDTTRRLLRSDLVRLLDANGIGDGPIFAALEAI